MLIKLFNQKKNFSPQNQEQNKFNRILLDLLLKTFDNYAHELNFLLFMWYSFIKFDIQK